MSAPTRKGAWHQSGLKSLTQECGFRWALENVLDVPTAPRPAASAGTAYHAAVEAHERDRMNGGPGISLREMHAVAQRHLTTVLPEMPEESFPVDRKTGLRASHREVRYWCRTAVDNWYRYHRPVLLNLTPLALEYYFRFELVEGANPVAGWIDAVYQDPDTGAVIVVDHKTAKDFSRYGTPDRQQPAQYCAGVVLSPDFPVDRLEDVTWWYMISRTRRGKTDRFLNWKTVPVNPTMSDMVDLGERVRDAQTLLDLRIFPRNVGWSPLCSKTYCPFYKECIETEEWAIPFDELEVKLRAERE